MTEDLAKLLASVRLHANAVSHDRIAHAERALGVRFPDDFKAFLAEHDGGQGKVGEAPIDLWRIDELISKNQDSEMTRASPGLVVFADDGGAEAYAFYCVQEDCTQVGRIGELAAGEHEFEPMGTSFAQFLKALAQTG
jgi:cell wall assembly regulator SMI1